MERTTDQGQQGTSSNRAAVWFGRVVWLGIIFNLFFIALQMFMPDAVIVGVGLLPGVPTVWNRAHGAMVLALTLLYMPAAVSPLRYPGYSWLVVVSRLVAAVFWTWCVVSGQGMFGSYLMMDGTFFLAEGVLLQMALPPPQRVPANIGALFASIGAGLKAAYASTAVKVATVVVVAAIAVVGWIAYDELLRHAPDPSYPDIVEQYKYGAIGLGSSSRVPYWILTVLPEMFPEKLPGPGGYTSVGMILSIPATVV